MLKLLVIITTLILLASCEDDNPKDIRYQKGDFWVSNFRDGNFPAKSFSNDKIYCSSLESGYNQQFFYCLNLKTGKVDWALPVKDWASLPPIVCDSFIYYCSFVGDLYKFDLKGNQLWYSPLNTTYGEHCINPINSNLIVGTVAYGLREFNSNTGRLVGYVGKGLIDVPLPVFIRDTIVQAINDSIFCRKASDDKYLWKKKAGDRIDRVFSKNGCIYYFDDTKCLYCVKVQTGKTIWQSEPIFPKSPYGPHLMFERGKIICYFSDPDEMVLLNGDKGNVEKHANYQELQKLGYLRTAIHKYIVPGDKGDFWDIKVVETLFEEYEVQVTKRHFR